MLTDELDYVLGVDTHRDEHVLAIVTAPAGAVVARTAAAADARSYRELLRVAARHAPGRRAWAIEGTGSYGAGLARFLAAATASYAAGSALTGAVLGSLVAALAFLAAATGFCTGCEAYKLGSFLIGRPFVSCPLPPQTGTRSE